MYAIILRTTSREPRDSALRRRAGIVAALVAGACIVSSCSIGVEETPRSWSSWDRFDEPPESSTLGVERIYLLTTEQNSSGSDAPMTTVNRDIDPGINAYRAILEVLFKGPTGDETEQGLRSSIPIGLSVVGDPKFEQGTVLVDLSDELTASFGDNLVNTLAQIVWTLCERPGTRQVRILVEGRQLSWPRADGTVVDRPLTPFDFPGYAITSQPDFPGIIDS